MKYALMLILAVLVLIIGGTLVVVLSNPSMVPLR